MTSGGKRGEQRRGHVDVVVGLAERRDHHVGEDHRHRLRADAAVGQADEEVVPHRGDLQDEHHDHDVAAHRQDDLAEDAPEGAGVHHRGAHDLLGDALVVVAEDQGEQRHGEGRMDDGDAPDGAVDLEEAGDQDQRHHDDLEGHESADEQDEEEAVGPLHVPQRQRVAGDRRDGDRQHQGGEEDLERVDEAGLDAVAAGARAGLAPRGDPGIEIEAPGQREDVALADLVHRLQRGHHDHVEGHAEEQGADGEEDQDGDLASPDAPLLARKGDRLVGARGGTAEGDVGGGAHCTRASCRRCCQAVSRTRGRKMAMVMASMTTAAAEARPRFCFCQ